MFELFPKLWLIIYEAKPIEQIGLALSVLPIVLSFFLWLRARVGARTALEQLANANERVRILAQNRDEAIAQRNQAIAERKACSPRDWLALAETEQLQGNDEKAMSGLAEGFETIRSDIARVAVALAGHHLGQIVGPDRASHCADGERFARIATLLDPRDADAAALAEEAALELSDGPDETDIPELTASTLPTNPDDATALIGKVCQHVDQQLARGRYFIGLRLARRAVLVSRKVDLIKLQPGYVARLKEAEALELLGKHSAAHEILSALVRDADGVFGEQNGTVLYVRSLEARILSQLGDHEVALSKFEYILNEAENVLEPNDSLFLTFLFHRSIILNRIGNSREAIDEIQKLLPIESSVLGPEHPSVLSIRYWEALFHFKLGEYEAANKLIAELQPVHERVKGREHPDVLSTQCLKARIFQKMGRFEEALEILNVLLPIEERVKGAEHPDVKETRDTIELIGNPDTAVQ